MSIEKKDNKPAVKEKYAIKVKGIETVTYPGKLDYAHQCGLKSIQTEIVQYPDETNKHMAICSTTVTTEDGKVFTDIGDASPDNVPAGCRGNYIRIASTRSKSRALSDAYNVAAQLDENSPDEYEANNNVIDVTPDSVPSPSKNTFAGGGSKPISDGQIRFISNLCHNKREDPEMVTQNKYGKSLTELVGSEANELIQLLQTPF